jgi:hypothetical protein
VGREAVQSPLAKTAHPAGRGFSILGSMGRSIGRLLCGGKTERASSHPLLKTLSSKGHSEERGLLDPLVRRGATVHEGGHLSSSKQRGGSKAFDPPSM